MTNTILALVDGSIYSKSVCDHLAWVAGRMSAGVELMHVFDRQAEARTSDLSGSIALGARFQDLWFVTAGTTIGMMLANAPAIFLGHRLLAFLPLRTIRAIAAGLFFAMGIGVLWSPM